MNYLSHEFVARGQSPAVRLGNMMPDLLASFDRSRRIEHRPQLWTALAGGAEADLLRGIRLHLELDRLFHGSLEFRRWMEAVKQTARRQRARCFHRFAHLSAHLAVELMLDGHLINYDGVAPKDTYELFDHALSVPGTTKILALVGIPEASFAEHLARFARYQYFNDYRTPDRLFVAMNRIFERLQDQGLRVEPYAHTDHQAVVAVLREARNICADYLPLLERLRRQTASL